MKVSWLIIPLILLWGCATTEDVSYVQHRLFLVEEKVENLAKRDDAFSRELRQTRADLETDMEALKGEIRALREDLKEKGQLLEELYKRMEGLEKEIASLKPTVTVSPLPKPSPPPPSPPPSTPEELYYRAYGAFKDKEYPAAEALFKEFLAKYPEHELADNAQFWLGECYYAQGDYERAILEYEKVLSRYPKGDKVPSALLKEGLSFLAIGDKVNGTFLLEKLLKEHPATLQASIARRKLEQLKGSQRR